MHVHIPLDCSRGIEVVPRRPPVSVRGVAHQEMRSLSSIIELALPCSFLERLGRVVTLRPLGIAFLHDLSSTLQPSDHFWNGHSRDLERGTISKTLRQAGRQADRLAGASMHEAAE